MGRSKTSTTEESKAGPDFLQLNVADAPAGELSRWLAEQLRLGIADGRLPPGTRLPATRVLAEELRVSRGVVTDAYLRLVDEGRLAGRGRAGTVVLAGPTQAPSNRRTARRAPTQPPSIAPFPPIAGAGAVDALRAATARIDLSPGVPDLAAFPRAAWLRTERAALAELSPADFGYGDPRGAPAFRVAVAHWLARNRGIRVDPEEVVVVAGVAQALALLARALGSHGIAEIAVEDPGSLGAREQLRSWGVATPPVAVDPAGLRVDELRSSGAPAVLLTPAHQFPTGVVLDGERRRELVRWAEDGGVVIEDDYDAEHRYDRPPVAALRSVLPEHVCYAGSVSKLLAPALRVGWLLAPGWLRPTVVSAKRDTDLGNAVLAQLVLGRLMESGELDRQLRFCRRRHRRRRDAMIEAIERHLPSAQLHGAAAGLHLLVTFPDGVDDVQLAGAALARGVKVQPLSWHCQRPHRPGLVMGYAANTPGTIAEGVEIVGKALRHLAS